MKNYSYNRDKIERKIKAGQGQGRFKDYKPWITVFDISSQGRVCTVFGSTVKRQYHFLSSLERDYFEVLDFNPNVIDILEQYPLLPIESTLYISEVLSIPHPCWYGQYQVMTTDFVIFYKQNNQIQQAVRSVKPSEKLSEPRVLEKFILEEEWWRSHGVKDWKIITEKQIDPETVKNIRELKLYETLENNSFFIDITPEETARLTELFEKRLKDSKKPTGEVINEFDRESGLNGLSIRLYKHLAFHHKVKADLTREDLGIIL